LQPILPSQIIILQKVYFGGTKWANLPNNELTWTINYNNTRTTTPGGGYTLITPTQNMINSIQTCMDDLAKIINIPISGKVSIPII